MKRTFYISFMILVMVFLPLLASALWGATYAEPLPPAKAVNHQTRQCAEILIPGDECGGVILPPNWEYLEEGAICPDDYAVVRLDVGRYGYKDPACCYEMGLYGTHGDCQDVVIHPSKRECAFVEDIQNCPSLPDDWKAWGKYCPDKYKWVDNIACTAKVSIQTTIPTSIQTAISTPTQIELTTRKPLLPCHSVGLAVVILLGMRFRRH